MTTLDDLNNYADRVDALIAESGDDPEYSHSRIDDLVEEAVRVAAEGGSIGGAFAVVAVRLLDATSGWTRWYA